MSSNLAAKRLTDEMTASDARFRHPRNNPLSKLRDRKDSGGMLAAAKARQIEHMNRLFDRQAFCERDQVEARDHEPVNQNEGNTAIRFVGTSAMKSQFIDDGPTTLKARGGGKTKIAQEFRILQSVQRGSLDETIISKQVF